MLNGHNNFILVPVSYDMYYTNYIHKAEQDTITKLMKQNLSKNSMKKSDLKTLKICLKFYNRYKTIIVKNKQQYKKKLEMSEDAILNSGLGLLARNTSG